MKKLWLLLNQPITLSSRGFVQAPTPKPMKGAKRGVALVMVLIILAVLSSMLLDFSYQTRAEIKAAKNLRDSVQAEYLARSAIEIERLLVAALSQTSPSLMPIGPDQITKVLEQVLNSGDISSVLGHAATAFNANGLGDLPGALLMPTPEKESSKLNINVLSTNLQGRQCTFQQLRDMVSAEQYLTLFEKEARLVPDPAGEFAGSVLDWSDRDTALFGGTGPENDPYGLLEDSYVKKDTPFYSLDELHLVWGVGDDLFYALADGLTVYGQATNSCAVDLFEPTNALRLRAALCSCVEDAEVIATCGVFPGPVDSFIAALQPMQPMLSMLGAAAPLRSLNDVEALISTGLAGLLGGGLSGGLNSLLQPPPDIAWKQTCPNVTFGARATVYTIRGVGEVGEVRVGIRAVVDLTQDRQQGGRLLYWRIE
jgi:type II secretory pathway component PulK